MAAGIIASAWFLPCNFPNNGYMKDGLQLTPDFGDKVFGTLGADYSIYDIQSSLRQLIGTGVGDAELLPKHRSCRLLESRLSTLRAP